MFENFIDLFSYPFLNPKIFQNDNIDSLDNFAKKNQIHAINFTL